MELIRQKHAIATRVVDDAAEAQLPTADGMGADPTGFGELRQRRRGVSVQTQSATDMRGGNQCDIQAAIRVEVVRFQPVRLSALEPNDCTPPSSQSPPCPTPPSSGDSTP